MKICENYASLLDAFADGELKPEQETAVRAHLAQCPACAAYVADALALRALLGGLEEPEAPAGLADGVMAAIRADAAPQKKKKSRYLAPLVSAAACAAIVFAAWQGLPGLGGGNALSGNAAPADSAPAAASAQESVAARSGDAQIAADSGENSPAVAALESGAAVDEQEPQSRDKAASEQLQATYGLNPSGSELYDTPSATQSAVGKTPQVSAALAEPEINAAGQMVSPDLPDAEQWLIGDNVVFSAIVCMTKDFAGSALDSYEGKPLSYDGGKTIAGTGYALAQEDFEKVLKETGYLLGPALNQARTTEFSCILVTDE